MSLEIENILSQVQKLDDQDKKQLIYRLAHQTKSLNQHTNPWMLIAGNLVKDSIQPCNLAKP